MSKLFDQLKNAARSREEKPPGILVDAMKKRYGRDPPHLVSWGTPVEELASQAETQSRPIPEAAPTRRISFAGAGLAVMIFAIAVFAWHTAPFRAPTKKRIDPSDLKLDRSLDLQRITPKGTSPAGQPS